MARPPRSLGPAVKVTIRPFKSGRGRASDGGGPLDGRLTLLNRFTADLVDPDAGYSVTMTLAAREGRLAAESVTVKSLRSKSPITSFDLRKIPVDTYIARIREEVGAMAGAALIVHQTRGKYVTTWTLVEADTWADFEAGQARVRRDPALSVPEAARHYREALADPLWSQRPTKYVESKMQCSRATAGRLVNRARNEGLLGEGIPGKAGEFTRASRSVRQ